MSRANDSLSAVAEALRGRYAIERPLGEGGMATVFLATDVKHHRRVAIKVIRPELRASMIQSRFALEIEVAAQLQHPHIVPLFDSGAAGDLLYYVMAYQEGESLRDRLARERPLPVSDALRVASEVADALAYAHEHGIVHRDVKPANILLASGHALLADFGIARALALAPQAEHLTATGTAIGTPAYMSPEQTLGESDIDGRSDVYSLGCVLYEMLTGDTPFPAATALAGHISRTPLSVRVVRPAVPERVAAIVRRALAKLPADRFQSATEFRDALNRSATGAGFPAVEPDPVTIAPSQPSLGRPVDSPSPGLVRGSLMLVALALAMVAGWQLGPWRHTDSLDPHRVVIFPLAVRAPLVSRIGADAGESAARLIGYSLEGSEGMRWIDAADHLAVAERDNQTVERQRELARSLSAAYFIDGSVEPRGDSALTVILRLHSVAGDSVVVRRGADGPSGTTAVPQIALRALRQLLPALLEPGQAVDAGALAERNPAAIVAFLQAEEAYRRSSIDTALVGYTHAVAIDSALAVAALKGAQAASWLDSTVTATQMLDVALAHVKRLPARYATFARALGAYLRGDADEALTGARTLVELEPRWVDAWFLLGEIYFHLLPSVPADSIDPLSTRAFRTARRLDPGFSPAAEHLLEQSFLHANIALADSLIPIVRRDKPDSDTRWIEPIRRCVLKGPDAVSWSSLGDATVRRGFDWGFALLFEPARGACARAAYAETLTNPRATLPDRWATLMGIHASLVAAGREHEAAAFVLSPAAHDLPGGALLIPAAAGGADVFADAERAALATGPPSVEMPSPRLWLLTTWYSFRADSAGLRQVHEALIARQSRAPNRLDSLVGAVAAAHLAAARGDSASAIAQLRALRPVAGYAELAYQPWEALAGERLLLARLLEANGRFAEAIAVAGTLDAPTAIIHLSYVRASLQLRERAAKALHDSAAAALFGQRMARLNRDRAPFADVVP